MAEQPPFRLILASNSPARRDLLTRAGYTFDVKPPNIFEPTHSGFADPRSLVGHIAWLKAAAIAPKIGISSSAPRPAVVLSADTIGWYQGQVVSKPRDEADARRILRLISGTVHELWTGVCLWLRPGDIQIAWQEFSLVSMNSLNDAELDAQIAVGAWKGNSGAYAICQEGDDPLVSVLRGTRSNVIGLPMESLAKTLERLVPALSSMQGA